MKKIKLSILSLLLSIAAHSQVGINTEEPSTTFHVVATNTNATTAEGIIAPNLTREQLISKDLKYTTLEKGAIVYVTDLSGTLTDKTALIKDVGYYYFDGSEWQPFGSGNFSNKVALVSLTSKEPVTNAEEGTLVYNTATVESQNVYPGLYLWDGTKWNLYYNDKNLNVSNGITITKDQDLGNSTIQLGGELNKKTTLTLPTSTSFEVKSASSTGGNLIITDNGNVGINVASPSGVLHTSGSVYHQNLNEHVLRLGYDMNPFLTVNTKDATKLGRIETLNTSTFGLAGGYRPPLTSIVQTVDVKNSIVKVDFVYYVDNSSDEINAVKEYYVYGSFTIIAAQNECRIVDVSFKDYYGKDLAKGETTTLKLACTITDNSITWNYPGIAAGQGTQTIKLNSSTGELSVIKGSNVFSYLFKFFGGIMGSAI